jgi:hypothetical protein
MVHKERTNFIPVNDAIDPAGLNASPISFSFTADGVSDVVIRVSPSNNLAQLRLNAFAVDVIPVPEPSTPVLVALGLAGLGWKSRHGR